MYSIKVFAGNFILIFKNFQCFVIFRISVVNVGLAAVSDLLASPAHSSFIRLPRDHPPPPALLTRPRVRVHPINASDQEVSLLR